MRSTLPSAVLVSVSVPGSSCSDCAQADVLVGEGLEDAVGGVDELGQLVVLAAERPASRRKLWIERRMFASRVASAPLSSARYLPVGSKRLSAFERFLPSPSRPWPPAAISSCR